VCSDGEDSYTLAVGAARDCLAHSRRGAHEIEMLISASISKNRGGLVHRLEPPMSLAVKSAIGAANALSFDLSNACAGMMSGVLVLYDFIRRGKIRCGMVVSGEYISSLGVNAAKRIRTVMSRELASLTLGDAGAAVIVERAPDGAPGISVAGFTTLSRYSRLCLGAPSKVGPGASMRTKARTIHRVAVADSPPLLAEALGESGVDFGAIDWVIPHQTSARAIQKGSAELSKALGVSPKHVVTNVTELGNTASTTHFVALRRYLEERRFARDDRVMLLSFASGLEVGIVIFGIDEMADRYGREDS
jgi:3-oxoacyl-[acyl-carrier-protein] synthase-3